MRYPHGGTNRPPHTRPGNGYGRPLKPGPVAWARHRAVDLDRELAKLIVAVDLVVEEAR